jgi:hypothetical protein
MNWDILRQSLHDTAGAITTTGALVIFFSWLVSNTLKEAYARRKRAIEEAKVYHQLFQAIRHLQQNIHTVTHELVGPRLIDELEKQKPSENGALLAASKRLLLKRLSAEQLNQLASLAGIALNFSNSIPGATDASISLASLTVQSCDLSSAVSISERRADHILNRALRSEDSGLTESALVAVAEHENFYLKEVLPQIPKLMEEAAAAINKRQEEAEVALLRVKRRAESSSRVALYLYVLGSLLALAGQIFKA